MKIIIRFFAERHKIATLFTLMVLLLGLNTLLSIKRSVYPDVDLGVMNVLTCYPDASPEDVERNVTNKLEEELQNVSGIDRMTSVSMENISTIDIYINVDARDKEKIKQKVRDAVGRVSDLPLEITESPRVTEMNTAEMDVIEVGLSGKLPYTELRERAKQIEKKLKNVSGVARLDRFGYRAREIRVEVSPEAMQEYQLPMDEIITAIQSRNINGTSGTFESYTHEKDIVTLAQFKDPNDVGDVIVRSGFDGPIIKIKNLALVKDDYEEEKLLSRINGTSAISFVVYLREDADVIRTNDAIKALIEVEKQHLPEGTTLEYVNDESRYVRNSFQAVLNNGLIGFGLVLLTLTLFLNVRTAFWVALGIPVALCGTIFLMPFFGQHLDTIGLTGMILVLGIIVDDAIIISENISRHRELGASPLEAVVGGTSEVFGPVVVTVFTTVIVFLPMFFLPGVMGKSMLPIPLAIILALFLSLLESGIALPAHLFPGLQRLKSAPRKKSLFLKISKKYQRLLFHLLRGRYVIVLIFFLLLAGTFRLGQDHLNFLLFPTGTSEHVIISNEMPAGTPLKITSVKMKEIEALVEQLPPHELDSFSTRIGINPYISGMHGAESENYGVISVNLTPYTERSRSTDDIVAELDQNVKKIPGLGKVNFSIVGTSPPVGKPVSLRVVGSNDQLRTMLADSVEVLLTAMEGVRDITRDDRGGKEQIELLLDYEKLNRYGATVADVARNVRTAYDGEVATRVRYGEEDVDFRVKLKKGKRDRISDLKNILIPNNKGFLLPLGQMTRLKTGPGPANIVHYDGDRAITIEAEVDQDKITPGEVTDKLFQNFNLSQDWPGMQIALTGEMLETEQSMQGLLRTFIIALIGVYFLLVILFNSFTQPILVMIAIPFGIMGVIVTFILHGEALSFMAIMGIIGLCGVVVNDSLVLVNHINDLKTNGAHEGIRSVIAEGTANRLRAVVLTTITTVAAILPLAYGLGGTTPFMAPLALALGWGLTFATFITLLMVPCLYHIGMDLGKMTHFFKK